MIEYTQNGIGYEWGLANSQGAWFVLRPIRHYDTQAEVVRAKQQLRDQRDVVSLRVDWQEGACPPDCPRCKAAGCYSVQSTSAKARGLEERTEASQCDDPPEDEPIDPSKEIVA